MAKADKVTHFDNTTTHNGPLRIEIADTDGGKTEYEMAGSTTNQTVHVAGNGAEIVLERNPDETPVLQQPGQGLHTPIVVRIVTQLPNPAVLPYGGGASWPGGRLVEYRMKKYTPPPSPYVTATASLTKGRLLQEASFTLGTEPGFLDSACHAFCRSRSSWHR
jgi:hypothetical protein